MIDIPGKLKFVAGLALLIVCAGLGAAEDDTSEAAAILVQVCAKWPNGYHGDESLAAAELQTGLADKQTRLQLLTPILIDQYSTCKLPPKVIRATVAGLLKDRSNSDLVSDLRLGDANANDRFLLMAAIVTLGERRDSSATRNLADLLARNDQGVFELVKRALLDCAASPAGEETVLRSIFEGHPDADEQYIQHAVEVAQSIRCRFTPMYLLEFLSHESPSVRLGAVRGLAKQHTTSNITHRLCLALKDKNALVAKEAAVALWKLNSVENLEALFQALDYPDAGVNKTVHLALEGLTGQTLAPSSQLWNAWWTAQRAEEDAKFHILSELFKIGSAETKAVCLEQMAELLFLHSKVTVFVAAQTHSSEFIVRAAALHVLSQTGDNSVASVLVEGLRDQRKEVAYTAWRGLQRISGARLPLSYSAWAEWFSKAN